MRRPISEMERALFGMRRLGHAPNADSDRNELNEKNINISPAETIDLKNIKNQDLNRIKTNISEMDRVLGGGIVPGSLILLGGEPGIYSCFFHSIHFCPLSAFGECPKSRIPNSARSISEIGRRILSRRKLTVF